MKKNQIIYLILFCAVFFFGTFCSVDAAWYNASWLYRVPIEINPDYVAADVTDYPVYVDLNDLPAGFHTNVTSDGGDIRVTTSDGTTEVARELVFYTAASDTGELHFLAPSISGTATTTFYIYYGNSSADDYAITDTYGAENVWADFVAVWHAQEASGSIIDATTNDNDLTETSGTIDSGTGWLAGTARDWEQIDTEYATVADNASINIGDNHLSIRTAVNLERNDNNSTLVSRYNTSSLRSYELSYFNITNSRFSFTVSGNGTAFTSVVANNFGTPSTATWYWVVAQHDPTANTIDIRVNNGTADSTSYSSGLYQNNQPLDLGRRVASTNYLDGLLDEVRIQKEIDITDDYLTTEYNNLSSPSTFYYVGGFEIGITGHWDASDTSSIFTTGGNPPSGTPVNGSEVQEWIDDDGKDNAWWYFNATGDSPNWRSPGEMVLPSLEFNGTSDEMQIYNIAGVTSRTFDTFFSATAYTTFVSFRIQSDCSNNATIYNNDAIFADTAGYFGLFCKTNAGVTSVTAYNYDTNEDTVSINISQDTDYVAMMRHQGGNLYLSLNNGAESSVASGVTGSLAGAMILGRSGFLATNYTPLIVGEVLFYDTALSGTAFTEIYSYMTDKWINAVTAPTVTTSAASSVTSSTATLNGSISATGGADATQHGFAYGTDSTLVSVIATSTLGAYSGTGSFNTGVTSLSPNTTYYFRAYATNSGGTGYGAIQSTTTPAAWYNASWGYRVPIEVNPNYVDADLTDYPVYVNLNNLPSGFHTNVNQTDARDIRVTKSDGTTEVPREVVFYTAASDTGELHFKASGTLSGTATTTFYVYYGNSGASDYALDATYGAENVWRSEYKGVWHMQALNDLDSTTNDNDGTAQAGHTSGDLLTGGKLAGSYHNFDDEGTDYISVGSGTSLDITTSGITISSWINTSDTGFNTIFGAYNASSPYNGYGFITGFPVASKLGYWSGTAGTWRGNANTVTGAWTFVQAAADSSSVIFYKNGASDGSTGGDHNPNAYASTKYIGSVAAGTNPFAGDIDELRIYAGKLDATWLSTEYNNQNSPSTFYWLGSQEVNPSPASTRIIRLKGGTRLRGIRLR